MCEGGLSAGLVGLSLCEAPALSLRQGRTPSTLRVLASRACLSALYCSAYQPMSIANERLMSGLMYQLTYLFFTAGTTGRGGAGGTSHTACPLLTSWLGSAASASIRGAV